MSLFKRIVFFLLLISIVLGTLINAFQPINCYFFSDIQYIILLGCVFVIMSILLYFTKPIPIKFEISLIDTLVIALFSCRILYLLISHNQAISNNFKLIENIIIVLVYFILKVYFLYQQKNNNDKYFIIGAFFTLTLFPIIIGISELSGIISAFSNQFPMCGGFMNPGVFADYLVILMPISLVVFLFAKNNIVKILSLVIYILSLAVIIYLNARTAWIACGISIIFIAFHNNKIKTFFKTIFNSSTKRNIIIAFSGILIIASAVFLYSMKKDSSDGRIFVWKQCLTIISEKPIFGHGSGSYIKEYNHNQIKYFEQHPSDKQNIKLAYEGVYAFNDFLQTTIEQGILGLILFLGIIFVIFRSRGRKFSLVNDHLALAFQTGLIAFLVCGLFSYPTFINSIEFVFYILLAYISSNYKPIYSINLNIKKTVTILLILLSLVASTEILNIKMFNKCREWKEAFVAFEKAPDAKILETYKKLAPSFQGNFGFTFNYGANLSRLGKYQESIIELEKAKKVQIIYDLSLTLGSDYEGTANYKKAEENYKNATNLIPHLLTPKYKLFRLYISTNQTGKAYEMASIIDKSEVKIFTPLAGSIKTEAFEYLKNHKIEYQMYTRAIPK